MGRPHRNRHSFFWAWPNFFVNNVRKQHFVLAKNRKSYLKGVQGGRGGGLISAMNECFFGELFPIPTGSDVCVRRWLKVKQNVQPPNQVAHLSGGNLTKHRQPDQSRNGQFVPTWGRYTGGWTEGQKWRNLQNHAAWRY